jgi:hypothetical protein
VIEEARALKNYYAIWLRWRIRASAHRFQKRPISFKQNSAYRLAIIDEMSQNRLKASHALEIINLDEREQKIINDARINKNMTVRDIRDVTRHFKSNERQKGKGEGKRQELNGYNEHRSNNSNIESNNDLIRQQTRLLQKTQLCLMISLH